MEVKLTQDTIVRFTAGSVVKVSEEEGNRLIMLGVAEQQTKKKRGAGK